MKSLSKFARAFAGVAAAVLVSHTAMAAEGQVQHTVSIMWSDMTPVVGAKVFDHASNTLLGVTSQDGSLVVTTTVGTVLRLVDPDYGQQQALQVVQAAEGDARTMNAANGSVSTRNVVFWFL